MSTADATSITLTGADIPALRRVLDALDNLAGIGVDGAGALDALLDAHVDAAAADRGRDDAVNLDAVRVGDPDPAPACTGDCTATTRQSGSMYGCTLDAGHTSQHIASGTRLVLAVWPR